MGSFVADLGTEHAREEAGRRGLAAAPHRGSTREVVRRGRACLGVSVHPELHDAWVAGDGGLVAAVTGDLDEVELLVGRSEREGHPVVDPTNPASVVCAAWRAWGEDTPTRLRGTYAIAVSDGDRLWVFRDHVGYRAAFYRRDAGGLTAASEAKQVVATSGIPPEPDLDVLERIYLTDVTDQLPTALKGVWRVPKATLLEGSIDHLRGRRYWSPEPLLETARYTDDELSDRFDEVFTRAVSRTFRGDDAVALSGGIDSPAIAAYGADPHRERFGSPLAALTASYPDHPSVDETRYATLVAERYAMPIHLYTPESSPTSDLQRWAQAFDGPVPIFLAEDATAMFEEAVRQGYRHLLGGFGAELVIDMRHSLIAHLLVTGRGGAASRVLRGPPPKGARPAPVAQEIVAVAAPRDAYAWFRGRVSLRRGGRVPPWLDETRVHRRAVEHTVAPRHRWRREQPVGFTGPGLTVEANEIVQEIYGVRMRRPWLDVDVWELFLSLPAEQKHPDATVKGLVRRLLRGHVPDELLDRTDRTVFDASVAARINYEELRRWLTGTEPLIGAVDYDLLEKRLADENMQVHEYLWARDLASVHAFAALWD